MKPRYSEFHVNRRREKVNIIANKIINALIIALFLGAIAITGLQPHI